MTVPGRRRLLARLGSGPLLSLVVWLVVGLALLNPWPALTRGADVQSFWTAPENVSQSPTNSYLPQVFVDRGGTVHLVYADYQPGHADIFYAARPPNSGWLPPVNLSNSPGTSNYPMVAVDGAGTIHVVWQDDTPGNSQVYYASKPTSGPWSTPANISESPGYARRPRLAIDRADTLHVVWGDNSGGHPQISYRSRAVGFDVWSPVSNISNTPGYADAPTIAVDSTGRLHVAWGDNSPGAFDIYYSSQAVGGGWSAPVNLSNSELTSVLPALAVGPNDSLHLVWNDDSTGNWEIYYRVRAPSGGWSATRNLSNTPGNIDDDNDPPALAVGADGLARVVWFDRSGPWRWDLYYTRQKPGGAWTPATPITGSGRAFFPALGLDAAGSSHIAWYDDSINNTNWEILYLQGDGL